MLSSRWARKKRVFYWLFLMRPARRKVELSRYVGDRSCRSSGRGLHTAAEQQKPESQEPWSGPHCWADTSEMETVRNKRTNRVSDVVLCMASSGRD